MSDSEDSTVTYTTISSLYVVRSGDVSLGEDGPPVMSKDPYAYVVAVFQALPAPDYVPSPEEPEQSPPSPVYMPYVPEPVYPEYIPVEDEVFPAEEQPLPAAALMMMRRRSPLEMMLRRRMRIYFTSYLFPPCKPSRSETYVSASVKEIDYVQLGIVNQDELKLQSRAFFSFCTAAYTEVKILPNLLRT
nr:hypothetical protein [Tanacetum cinerariifolium]